MIARHAYKKLRERKQAAATADQVGRSEPRAAARHSGVGVPTTAVAAAEESTSTQSRRTVIDAEGLVKRYGSLTAVDNVSFRVEFGEIFGLLGPNGAGKTTTLEMLEGLRSPDSGDAMVLGESVVRHSRHIKERIGVQLQATALPPKTTVTEAIELFGSFYPRRRTTDDLLREFDLTERADAFAENLSGGQLQRLSIALALVNDPDLVFLDEPTTGLDPQARLNLWDVIAGIHGRGKTVVLTTHYMEEAERLCDRVAVIDRGKIVALDTPLRLIAEYAPGTTIEFESADPNEAALRSLPGVDRLDVTGSRVTLHTVTPEHVLAALFEPDAAWAPAVGSMRDLRVRTGTLEDVFIALTGRTLRS